MYQLQQKVNPHVVTKTLQLSCVQKESQQLGTYVSQTHFRASSAKAVNDPPGVEARCFLNGRNSVVATPSIPSSSHRASLN